MTFCWIVLGIYLHFSQNPSIPRYYLQQIDATGQMVKVELEKLTRTLVGFLTTYNR